MVGNLCIYFVLRMRDIIVSHNIDVEELSRRANVSYSNLRRILDLKYSPPLEVIERLFVCLNIQVKLFDGRDTFCNGVVYSSQSHVCLK